MNSRPPYPYYPGYPINAPPPPWADPPPAWVNPGYYSNPGYNSNLGYYSNRGYHSNMTYPGEWGTYPTGSRGNIPLPPYLPHNGPPVYDVCDGPTEIPDEIPPLVNGSDSSDSVADMQPISQLDPRMFRQPQHRKSRASNVQRRKSLVARSPSKTRFKNLRNQNSRLKLRGPGIHVRHKAPEHLIDATNLVPRPDEWRFDYKTPRDEARLSRRLSRCIRGAMEKKPEPSYSYSLHSFLEYFNTATNPVAYDIRHDPVELDIQFLNIMRPSNDIDYLQLATNPPVDELCLWHERLPWYIHIRASQANGVTIRDVFNQMYEQLSQSIAAKDYFTKVLDSRDREDMATAFFYRCGGVRANNSRMARGMLRMDFLVFDVIFLGLAKSKDGMWEIKTADALP
ncbi:hypothetical protein Hypma_006431 [Hypsizygus marmoreus]|uniref:DUF6699 domain-containing protein n=1 Tax=Hypsizygus marmoreus TaxID=39966 RepID=A0A369JZL3_HYPMA|nr:hypothetical protein Hypma_006431 [Hypsizygus marmoreus]